MASHMATDRAGSSWMRSLMPSWCAGTVKPSPGRLIIRKVFSTAMSAPISARTHPMTGPQVTARRAQSCIRCGLAVTLPSPGRAVSWRASAAVSSWLHQVTGAKYPHRAKTLA
jgi:hypothetical protein